MKILKSKTGLLAIVLLLIAVLIALLFYNRTKTEEESGGWRADKYYVSVNKAVLKNVSEEVTLTGTTNAFSDVNLISETTGRVTSVFFNTGDYVSKGKLLAQVDDELRLAAYENAKAIYEKVKKDFDRAQNLLAANSVTESQFESAKTALTQAETNLIVTRRQYQDTKITAPVSGFVTLKNIDVGYTLQGPPAPSFIANIADISRLKIKVLVSEKLAVTIKKGDKAKIETDVFPEKQFNGTVLSVSVKGDEAHTYPAELLIQNDNNLMKAGMFARVTLKSGIMKESLIIPRKALLESKKNSGVFIVQEGKARFRKIVTGIETGTEIEVLSGINKGDLVVTSGQSLLKDGFAVEIVE
ncbi:MAG: efflux RND transporter periplasmic adaptor subunit [Ignavibacteriales bacterium]|nr:MAG: efflux RND transporter periplasmic adaptor subunit [Ignavibacteriales bacterium]